jgi:hypothetical protein
MLSKTLRFWFSLELVVKVDICFTLFLPGADQADMSTLEILRALLSVLYTLSHT